MEPNSDAAGTATETGLSEVYHVYRQHHGLATPQPKHILPPPPSLGKRAVEARKKREQERELMGMSHVERMLAADHSEGTNR